MSELSLADLGLNIPEDIPQMPDDTIEKLLTPYEMTISDADPYAVPIQDFEQVQRNALEKFDKEAWESGNGYDAPDFPIWSEALEGLGKGFYIFAGYPNSGKSALCMNLVDSYIKHDENHLYALYFTLDDTASMIIPRFIAMHQSIPIAVAARPKRFQDMIDRGETGSSVYQEFLRKRDEGLKELQNMSSRMLIQESNDVFCAERMLNMAIAYKTFVQSKDPKANILVVVDSLMDVNIDSANYRDEKERNSHISQMMKDWADNKLECPVFGTAHLRKNSASRRPVISDLKESGRYEYDATAVFLIANDVSRYGQNADIYYNSPNDDEKHPILEIQFAKNKASDFKERTYCFFTPKFSKAVECNKELTAQFDEKIYSL